MHKCLVCNQTWGDKLDDDGLYSHGLCSECLKSHFKPRFHQEQLRYSGIQCYAGPPKDYDCPEAECRYYESCRSFTEYKAG
jgi:hypothetical protein